MARKLKKATTKINHVASHRGQEVETTKKLKLNVLVAIFFSSLITRHHQS